MINNSNNVVILGAGLTGMAAASVLKDKATVFEKTERPGGLVKSINMNGYWFDHVIHLLHFKDPDTEAKVKSILGDILAPLYPEAWVETSEGIGKYPLQMHMFGLNKDAIVKSLRDLAEVTFSKNELKPENFEDMLRFSFGNYFSELFMLPYNRKVWKRPLNSLAPSGFQWNIDHPDYNLVLKGAMSDHTEFESYNSNGWYPRPDKNFRVRGMEVLSVKLAEQVRDLRLNHEVESINLKEKRITVKNDAGQSDYNFSDWCLSTIPLPHLISRCEDLDPHYKECYKTLKYNRVISVIISIKGPRPENRGHWRYYADEEVAFTRLVYMHNFDPETAPKEGWGLLAEIIEPAEWPLKNKEEVLEKVVSDVKKVGALPDDCNVLEKDMFVVDPAYVVFTNESKKMVSELESYFSDNKVKLLGRYGRWEYSSMAQVMRDGFNWAKGIEL